MSNGGSVFFTYDRTELESRCPGLPEEDFEEANVPPGGITGFEGPLDSTSSNAVFSSGDIIPGVTFEGVTTLPDSLSVPAAGHYGAASKFLLYNWSNSYMTIDFPAGTVNTVLMDVIRVNGVYYKITALMVANLI